MMVQCIAKGYIKENKDSQGYEITQNWFIENTLDDRESGVYNEIANYCMGKSLRRQILLLSLDGRGIFF